ncbi:hypothetical protein L5515_010741 [Caenorhabditis briggsae]|uniref:Sdz-33 F-box domain-containing protein n=1 Tax=Caenorhabditis briggsae TaxID=6238 RepID=A0AAE9EUJ3_CAEBR|nr:hypothetical protein L5515_010741 [Caenorhabditis briggsae]
MCTCDRRRHVAFVRVLGEYGRCGCSDGLSVVINNCKVIHCLSVSTSTVFDIKPLNPTIKTDYISIVGVPSISWMSIDNLITFDCVHIDLSGFIFDEMGSNRYLKAWISGCNPRMEYLKSYFYFIDLEKAPHDIELKTVHHQKDFIIIICLMNRLTRQEVLRFVAITEIWLHSNKNLLYGRIRNHGYNTSLPFWCGIQIKINYTHK